MQIHFHSLLCSCLPWVPILLSMTVLHSKQFVFKLLTDSVRKVLACCHLKTNLSLFVFLTHTGRTEKLLLCECEQSVNAGSVTDTLLTHTHTHMTDTTFLTLYFRSFKRTLRPE